MLFLPQSTAATFRIGPFVDATDGFTPETTLTLSQADYRLSKNGGAFAQKNETTSGAHDENGWYTCILDATDTGTLGPLTIAVYESGARPVYRELTVVTSAIYAGLISTGGQLATQSNVTTVGNNTVAIYNRIGAPVGASISADIAAIDTDVGGLAAATATAVLESEIDANDDGTPGGTTSTVRRRLRQIWQAVGR